MKTEEYNIITEYSKINSKEWDDFVLNHPDGNIFQSPQMYKFHESVSNHIPFVFAVQSGEKILGLLSGAIMSNGFGPEKYFSRRAIIWGGPLTIKNEDLRIKKIIVEKLLSAFDSFIQKRAVYSEFRNLFDLTEYKDIFLKMRFRYEEHLNFIIDLTLSEEQLWKNLNQKRRNSIRKAQKENITSLETTSESDLEESYKIIKDVYKRAALPYPNLIYFKKALKYLTSGHFKVFSAYFEGKMIAIVYALCYKDIIYDWYAGSYSEYYGKYPNCLIPWDVFKWGKNNGYRKFDFGGAGKPDEPYGVRDFKKKYGGEMVNFGRYKKINSKFLYKIGEIGIKYFGRIGMMYHNIFNNK